MKKLMDVSLKRIQYFLMIAQCGSLSKAAQTLYISQPMLSKSMKELEHELNISLFNRQGRLLVLSDAGKYLYEQWSSLLDQIITQVDEAREIEQRANHIIRIACEHIMVLGANDLWMDSITQYQNEHADVFVDMRSLHLHELKKQLLNQQLDMIICASYDTHDLPADYHVKRITSLPVYIYGRKTHPVLSTISSLHWKDLKHASFYTISPMISTWPQELLVNFCNEEGFQPKIAGYTDTQMTQLMKIKTSDYLMLSLELQPLLMDDNLCAKKISDEVTDIMLVWKKGFPFIDIFAQYLCG